MAIAALVALALLTTHAFSLTVGRAPALAFDDALAGISANLAREGRLGFDAIPVNPLALASQHENFFNYGPWYFVLGGLLDWLFGTSYEVYRWLHLLGVLATILLAREFFRSGTGYGFATYGAGALLSFHYHQWPMVRVDIIGSVGVALALVFARMALTRGGLWPVFGFGLSVGIAVTNHPIVAALVPWSVLVLVGIAAAKGGEIRARHSFGMLLVSLAAGLGLAGVGLLAAAGFRIEAISRLYFLYPAFVHSVGPGIGFIESIDRHLSFVGLAPGRAQGAAGVLLFLVLIDFLAFVRRPRVESAITLLPGTAWGAYLISLGVFKNVHEGYVILIQLLFVWTLSAFLVRFGRSLAAIAEIGIPLASLALLASQPGRWEAVADQNVPYREYIDRVRDDIPRNAYVQGEAIFGLDRPNWVDMAYADLLARGFRPEIRDRFVPDFLVISEREWEKECLQAARLAPPRLFEPGKAVQSRNMGGFFNQIPWLFRGHSFQLVRIVSAPPYGATRLYVMENAVGASSRSPGVSVWSPRDLWQHRIDEFRQPLTPVDRISVSLPESGWESGPSETEDAWEAELDPGTYLLEVVGPSEARVAGCVFATAQQTVRSRGDLLGAAPRLPGEEVTHLVVVHGGGALRLGHLSSGPPGAVAASAVTALRIVPTLLSGDTRGKPYPAALMECLNEPRGSECVPAPREE